MEAEHYLVKPCSVETILKAIRLVAKLIPQHKFQSELVDNDINLIE
jgi:YesN/AraC family two-component response regulator